MLNKRNANEYKEYVGMIFSTLPESVKDLSGIKTFLISNITTAAGIKEYIKVYGKLEGNNFVPDPIIACNDDCTAYDTQNCDEIVDMIANGQLSVEQKFEHRKFSTIKLSDTEIKKTLGKIVPFYI